MRKLLAGAVVVALALGGWWLNPSVDGPLPETTGAEMPREGYLLLAISWTPSWCVHEGDARGAARCADGADTGWLVHGLWPQHDAGGWPEFCDTPHPGPSRAETAAMIDIMGSDGLAFHQWRKHGTCTGLSSQTYFDQTRAAFAALSLPEFDAAGAQITPSDLLARFRAANPEVDTDMAILTCRDGMAQEIRLCMTHDLEPRACDAALLERNCRARSVRLPPRP